LNLTTTNNGNIAVNSNLTGFSAVTLSANGSGVISEQSAFSITTGWLTALSGTGNVGSPTLNLSTNAASVTARTGGSVYINDSYTSNVTLTGLNNAGASGTFFMTAPNNTGTGIRTGSASSIAGGTIVLNSINGDIGTAAAPVAISGSTSPNLTTSAALGSVYVSSAPSLTLRSTSVGSTNYNNVAAGTYSVASADSVTVANNLSAASANLQSGAAGSIAQSGGTVNAQTVTLTAGTGGIGSSSAPVLMQAANLTANSNGSAYMSNTGSVAVLGGTAANGGVLII
jgi:hypothetical protein